jgi:hypothetical protein
MVASAASPRKLRFKPGMIKSPGRQAFSGIVRDLWRRRIVADKVFTKTRQVYFCDSREVPGCMETVSWSWPEFRHGKQG